jgi:hypothetical protein
MSALQTSRGLWNLGRPRRLGPGRCGSRSDHSASDRSLEYVSLGMTRSVRHHAILFQKVSPRTHLPNTPVNRCKKLSYPVHGC